MIVSSPHPTADSTMSSSGGGAEPVGDVPKAPASSNDAVESAAGASSEQEAPDGGSGKDTIENERTTSSTSPALQPQPNTYPQAYPPHLTPQPGPGYYLSYQQQQITPEPPSPGGPTAAGGYDVASFLQQQAALAQQSGVMSNPFGPNSQYSNIPQPPLSPRGGVLHPPSPLFPRVANNSAGISGSALDSSQHQSDSSLPRGPPSPSAYLSPPLGPSAGSGYTGVHQGYGGSYGNITESGHGSTNSNNSPEEPSWADRSQQQNPYQQAASPQLQAQGVAVQYAAGMARAAANHRANSFDDMLPPSMLDHQDQSPVTYSPYGASAQTASGQTMFAHQQPWGYGAPGDLYAPNSPLQPRPNPNLHQLPGHYGGGQGGGMRQMGGYPGPHGGMPPYYPASSPGPPIQTTVSNKGPDGANLFIFHIPNHFTNLDMYHLFCQYGNLLSVRIMVEKDTGRSRGFGFVSYDSPESAAMAIKELNGFAIGNKRLKVQHKQIRASDRQQEHQPSSFGSSDSSLPPPSRWYDSQKPAPQAAPQGSPEAHAEDSGTSDAAPLGHASAGGQLLGSPNDENLKVTANAQSTAGGPESPAKSGVDMSRSSAPSSGGVDISRAAGSSTLSPLGNLEPMRNALPDVSD